MPIIRLWLVVDGRGGQIRPRRNHEDNMENATPIRLMDSHQKVREMESRIANLRREGKHSEAVTLYDEMARGVRRIWRDEVQAAIKRW